MYIKSILFYSLVLFLRSVLSGVSLDNSLHVRDTQRTSLSDYHNAQNGQNKNIPSTLLSSTNIKQEQPIILHQQLQNFKDPTLKSGQQLQDSLLPYGPLDIVLNKSMMRQPPIIREGILNSNNQYLSSKKFENLHMNVNKHAVTTQRNDKIIDNRFSNDPEKFKVLPFTSLVEDKNKVRTSNIHTRSPLLNSSTRSDLVQNENRQIIIPSALRPLSRAPNIDVNKLHSNKLTPINQVVDRQKPATNQQNIFNNHGNMQSPRASQNLGTNVQPNYKNKRFTVIHKNGAVEYFDDLEIILKIYPQITMADNIRKLIPTKNPVANTMTHISNPLGNIKINRPLEQKPNLRNVNLQPRKMPLHTVNTTLEPRMGNNNQQKNTSKLNESNRNFKTLQTSTPLQFFLDNNAKSLATKHEEVPNKPTNNNETKSTGLQENKSKNFISNMRIFKQPDTVVTTTDSSISNKNDITASHKYQIPTELQKVPIDVRLNNLTFKQHLKNENLPNQQKETSAVISNNTHENYENYTSVPEKDDLNSNKSKEIILNETISNELVNTPENHLDLTGIVNDNSSSPQNSTDCDKNHETVADKSGESQLNDTKDVKHKLKSENLEKINQSIKDGVKINQSIKNGVKINQSIKGDDYDEDFLSLVKPFMWFSTTDPEFWKKAVNVDDTPSFIYVINVQSQPKIEKDRKTTIYANGTVVEETTETVWDVGDDEPKITKTIKITPANDVVDE